MYMVMEGCHDQGQRFWKDLSASFRIECGVGELGVEGAISVPAAGPECSL